MIEQKTIYEVAPVEKVIEPGRYADHVLDGWVNFIFEATKDERVEELEDGSFTGLADAIPDRLVGLKELGDCPRASEGGCTMQIEFEGDQISASGSKFILRCAGAVCNSQEEAEEFEKTVSRTCNGRQLNAAHQLTHWFGESWRGRENILRKVAEAERALDDANHELDQSYYFKPIPH